MEPLHKEIMKTVIYFSIFSHPVSLEEIHRYCGLKVCREELENALKSLLASGKVYFKKGYYVLHPDHQWAEKRQTKYKYSCKKMIDARKNARLISRFPFVRGVAISGSLSKYSADEQADIDFFIITDAGRLWICRSFLHLFKKLTYLVQKQHNFCMNFFLDSNELELKDKNLFTAIESVTVIPLYGKQTHLNFYDRNKWIKHFFPNMDPQQNINGYLREDQFRSKKWIEWIFTGRFGDTINRMIMSFTVNWWKFKFSLKGYSKDIFDKGMRSSPGESKYHPNDYQQTILARYEEKMEQFEQNYYN